MFAVKILQSAHRGFMPINADFTSAGDALAWLIADATSLGRQVAYEWDASHPGCADIIVFGDRYAEQYSIEPVKA